MDWTLTFKESQPVTLEQCQHAVSAFVGGPVSTDVPELTGNPRDRYYRTVTITAPYRDMSLSLSVNQDAWMQNDDKPDSNLGGLTLRGSDFQTMLDTWQALRVAFAPLGWTDRTLITYPGRILDDAEAAGEHATAAFLRSEITMAWLAYAKAPDGPRNFEVRICSPRTESINEVLDAWAAPEGIVFMHLDDCGLRELPPAFARFPNIELLSLRDNPLDISAVHVNLPKLYFLTLSGCQISTVTDEDLARFPALKHLDIQNTPFASEHARLAELRARWPNVSIST